MEESCIFCKIVNKEIPSEVVFEDEEVVAFKDLNPQAPLHVLFVPKKHIATLNDASSSDEGLLGRILTRVKDVAKEENVSEDGYRVVINCNKGAGQEVFHLHVHLLGGRSFTWPPG